MDFLNDQIIRKVGKNYIEFKRKFKEFKASYNLSVLYQELKKSQRKDHRELKKQIKQFPVVSVSHMFKFFFCFFFNFFLKTRIILRDMDEFLLSLATLASRDFWRKFKERQDRYEREDGILKENENNIIIRNDNENSNNTNNNNENLNSNNINSNSSNNNHNNYNN